MNPEKDLLIICPTRSRPVLCSQMIESFDKKSSAYAQLVFIIDADDPCYIEYEEIFKKTKHSYITNYQNTLTEMYNVMVSKYYDNYKFYGISNDDYIYHTGNWDQILMHKLLEEGGGIAYAEDGFSGSNNLPTASIISGDIIRALKWLNLPGLEYLCGDMVWREIGQKLNCLYFVKEVYIEHITPYNHKRERDEVFEKTNHPDTYTRDNKTFRVWRDTQMKKDIEKVKEAL